MDNPNHSTKNLEFVKIAGDGDKSDVGKRVKDSVLAAAALKSGGAKSKDSTSGKNEVSWQRFFIRKKNPSINFLHYDFTRNIQKHKKERKRKKSYLQLEMFLRFKMFLILELFL